jgi:elongation factor P--(R)-beta-lysine ligase
MWRPTISPETLRLRAALLARARAFFAARGVLEVDTPVMVRAAVSDVHIHSARVQLGGAGEPYFLHTSPEYAMKRLLAAGSGDIFQICHVVRADEHGPLHNPEFTLIEWYRIGYSAEQLMDETASLVRELTGAALGGESEKLSWRDAFLRHAGFDPLEVTPERMRDMARHLGLAENTAGSATSDELFDFLMASRVGPRLGDAHLTFLHRYPASQAALARLDPEDPRFAQRFELFYRGIELANGFAELGSGGEQRMRFAQDLAERERRGLPREPLDEGLLGALEAGLPECSGVAVGFDRVLMIAAGACQIDEVLPFPTSRA